MNIVVCDDDPVWLKTAEGIITEYGSQKGLPLLVSRCSSGKELFLSTTETPDVLFLDIQLEQENGIDVAAQVNQVWPNCQIVYLTDYLSYAIDVYHTDHIFFMVKEQFEERLDEIFEKIFREIQQREQKLVFNLNGGRDSDGTEIVVEPREILYFERQKRLTLLVTERGEYRIHENLDTILQQVSAVDFVRCHNSYIVYLPAVSIKKKNHFLMKNQEEIVISRSYHAKVKEAFLRWAMLL